MTLLIQSAELQQGKYTNSLIHCFEIIHFKLFLPDSRKCGMNGIWSGKTWRCVPRHINPNAKSCVPSNMPFVKNGKYKCSQGHGLGKYCSVECAPGFIQDARTVSKLTCVRSKGLLSWRKSGGRSYERLNNPRWGTCACSCTYR